MEWVTHDGRKTMRCSSRARIRHMHFAQRHQINYIFKQNLTKKFYSQKSSNSKRTVSKFQKRNASQHWQQMQREQKNNGKSIGWKENSSISTVIMQHLNVEWFFVPSSKSARPCHGQPQSVYPRRNIFLYFLCSTVFVRTYNSVLSYLHS